MSLPLKDIGNIKVSERTHSLLKARAFVKQVEVSTLARELLDKWAVDELHVFSMAEAIHESKGFGAINSDEGR
jgi:hypothetical protein